VPLFSETQYSCDCIIKRARYTVKPVFLRALYFANFASLTSVCVCVCADAVMRLCSWVICDDTSRHTRYGSGLHAVTATTQPTPSVISRYIRVAGILRAHLQHQWLLHSGSLLAPVCSVVSVITSLVMHQIWSAIWD